MGEVLKGRFEGVSAEVPTPSGAHIENAKFGDGEGGGGPMDPISGKDYVDARVGELRAENRANLAEIKSLIEIKLGALDNLPTHREFWSGIVATIIGVVGLTLGILTYSGERSDAAAGSGAALQRLQASEDANSRSIQQVRSDMGFTKPK